MYNYRCIALSLSIYIYIYIYNNNNDNNNKHTYVCISLSLYIYIYTYVYVCICLCMYVYIYIYALTYILSCVPERVRALSGKGDESGSRPSGNRHAANLRTRIMDFGGFGSSRILLLRGRILRPTGNFPESWSQRILVGIILVGRLGARRISL